MKSKLFEYPKARQHDKHTDSLTCRTTTLLRVRNQKFSFIASLKSSVFVNFHTHFKENILISHRLIQKVKKIIEKYLSKLGFDSVHTASMYFHKRYTVRVHYWHSQVQSCLYWDPATAGERKAIILLHQMKHQDYNF